MRRSVFKYLFISTLTFALLFVIVTAGIFTWLKFYPESTNIITAKIKENFQEFFPENELIIGKSSLEYDFSSLDFVIAIDDLKIKDNSAVNIEDNITMNLPKMKLYYNVIDVILGEFIPNDIQILNPDFNLDLSKFYSTQDEVTTDDVGLLDLAINIIAGVKKTKINLNKLYLKNANFVINGPYGKKSLHIKDIRFFVENHDDGFKVQANTNFEYDQHLNRLKIFIGHNFQKEIFLLVDAHQVSSKILHDLLPQTVFLHHDKIIDTDIEVSGKSYFVFDLEKKLKNFDVDIDNIKGKLNIPQIFPDIIDINNLALKGNLSNYDNLFIDNLLLENDDFELKINGSVKNYFTNFSTDINVEIRDLLYENLKKYWPLKLESETRQWLTERINNGNIPYANGKFKITKEMVDSQIFPEDAINASVNFNKLNVNYTDNLPNLINASGQANFGPRVVLINVDKAELNKAQLKEASLILPYKKKVIAIDGNAEGSVEALLPFVNIIQKDEDSILNYIRKDNIAGLFDTNIKLELPIKNTLSNNDIDLSLKGKITNLAIKEFYKNKMIDDADLEISLINNLFRLKGNTNYNHTAFYFDFNKDLGNLDNIWKLNLNSDAISMDFIRSLDIELPDISSDYGKLSLQTEHKDNKKNINVRFDMTNMNINIDEFSVNKPKNTTAILNANAIIDQNDNLSVDYFNFQSPNLSGTGKIILNKDKIKELSVNNFQFGKNLISFMILRSNNILNITANGKYLDLTKYDFKKFWKNNNGKNSNLRVNASIETALMHNNIKLENINLKLKKDTSRIQKLHFGANLPKEKFMMLKYDIVEDKGVVDFTSNDLGAVLRSFDITDNIRNGDLVLTASKNLRNNVATGNLIIKNYNVKKAPVLAHILTLSSFTGIVQRLNGEGILFSKLNAPFIYKNDEVHFIDAKTYGASIGITFDGNVDFNTTRLNLNGTITPAYEINSLLADIPLVGEVLSGNEQGIIAANYKLRGTIEKPKVNINPLSILAPGFLRKLFEKDSLDKKIILEEDEMP